MKGALTKHLNIIDYTLSSLWRRRSRNGSVLIVFAGVIFLVASFQFVTGALTETALDSLRSAPEITVQRLSAGRQTEVPLDYGGQIAGIHGVREVVPRIWGYYFDEVTGANLTLIGVELERMPLGEKLNLTLAEGEVPEPGSTGWVLVGRSIKRIVKSKGTAYLSLFRPDLSQASFAIAGVFDAVTDVLTDDLIVMDIRDARDLFHISPAAATDLCVYVANLEEVPNIARKIAAALPDARVLTRSQISQTYQVVFGWRSGFASVCLLTALAAFVIFAWDKASGLSPEERREIGILKILGWETSDILAVRFWEGALIAGGAFIAGCTGAYIHVAYFDASLFRPVMVGWSVIHPSLRLVPSLQVSTLLLIFCFTVLPYMAATVIPAWRSAIVPTDSVLSGL